MTSHTLPLSHASTSSLLSLALSRACDTHVPGAPVVGREPAAQHDVVRYPSDEVGATAVLGHLGLYLFPGPPLLLYYCYLALSYTHFLIASLSGDSAC